MFAITGITGQVGRQLAGRLLAAGLPVRAVVRDAAKGEAWRARGCEVALAEMHDAAGLTEAFRGATAVFVLLPPVFDPSPDFDETRRHIAALAEALSAARPARVVALSTIGAQAAEPNLLSKLGVMEEVLGGLDLPVTFLRAAWFIENLAWDVAPARETGLMASYLQPLDRPVAMVATADVAEAAAELLQDDWAGQRVVDLEGPSRLAPVNLAAALASALRRDVRAEAVPRESWEARFRRDGMRNPGPRMRMLDGFNEGWIDFNAATSRKGRTTLEEVVRKLVGKVMGDVA
ncbi:NAD(P)H-binding protein [Roseateles sp. NT4]|uniref:NAD(P)H-binding protein n=1 Tax=Roseateles sp. NT4 TaxID=3453715 RepID=UPI003EEB0245